MRVHGHDVRGVEIDPRTGCSHYRGPTDIVSIRFACCRTYYACHQCHGAMAGHAAQRWKSRDFTEKAVLCGACGAELSIARYLQCTVGCPECGARFNPGCAAHHHLYFEVEKGHGT